MTKQIQLLSIDEISAVSGVPVPLLKAMSEYEPVRITRYYSMLVDWANPDDPLRRIVLPVEDEHVDTGKDDPSNEIAFTRQRGVQHKYASTALILVSGQCQSYCRYCFRKRLFTNENEEVGIDASAASDYLRANSQIRDVILSGGDPLFLQTPSLARILDDLGAVSTIETVRIHTRAPAFDPTRIIEDRELQRLLARQGKRFHLVAALHFDHPREITPSATEAIEILNGAGAETLLQFPLLRGINDSPVVLASLYREASRSGCAPYYMFQCRPVRRSRHFAVPILDGLRLHQEAHALCTGLERRARYVMSHETGKYEIVGTMESRVLVLRRLSAPVNDAITSRLLLANIDSSTTWIENAEESSRSSLA